MALSKEQIQIVTDDRSEITKLQQIYRASGDKKLAEALETAPITVLELPGEKGYLQKLVLVGYTGVEITEVSQAYHATKIRLTSSEDQSSQPPIQFHELTIDNVPPRVWINRGKISDGHVSGVDFCAHLSPSGTSISGGTGIARQSPMASLPDRAVKENGYFDVRKAAFVDFHLSYQTTLREQGIVATGPLQQLLIEQVV